MKYKVGDKIRIVKNDDNDFEVGEIAIIGNIDEDVTYGIYCKNENNCEWLRKIDILPLDYTWEDFLKCPIGTKVIFESGKNLFKVDKDEYGDEFANMSDNFSYEELEGFKIKYSDYGKIIKIEEPTYTTVYEPTEEVEEMTMEEVCKALGKQIKIVKEKTNE